ncbi:cytidine deaminase [Vagococcus sp. BWB3-3]|uniref:Cytidine deaminase n=1 Tax=Vagococcus allomyrinae TaxID=2794353 RepID=A0A940PC51_9ENTE|nr:cytidine deaminase [Vagococcus allomyrinae]MBP1041822.1 cytidine deaminase [Vagococcus allomyrinae]
MEFSEMIKIAASVVNPKDYSVYANGGSVGAALLTESGRVYSGICIDATCSLGFCAEHAAAAEMLKAGENRVVKMVAVRSETEILAPCGRCREFISQLHRDNYLTDVLLPSGEVKTLRELLPSDWKN